VGLFLGFYMLAIGLSGVLLWLPYAEWTYAGRVHIKLALGAVVIALAILRGSLFVPAPRFEPPGPEITEADEPVLFGVIREIATRMNTAMPARVYLIPDVNAFVTEVGGFWGIGSQRVMGIGLGLLSVDTVSQLKATIAHEFGHYVGGDTRLGGFVYRTRAAIGRVLGTLGDSWVSKPFELYANLFMKVSHSVSRSQELAADRASVAIAGKAAHVTGLEQEGRGGAIFGSFMGAEVEPLVASGFCPDNLYEGFRTYSSEVFSSEKLAALDGLLAKQETDPHERCRRPGSGRPGTCRG
jgi:Zn-dependent protease with chaperone function